MSEDGPASCEVCKKHPIERVLFPVAVHFKGSGFYSTDYGRGNRQRDGESGSDDKKTADKSGSDSSSGDAGDSSGGDSSDSSSKGSSEGSSSSKSDGKDKKKTADA